MTGASAGYRRRMSLGPMVGTSLATPAVATANPATSRPHDDVLSGVPIPPGSPLLATLGFVAPGIEMVIHAMRLLRDEHPDLQYVVAGRTHPDVARRDGERFRWCLEALADDLGLAGRVHLVDRPWSAADHAQLVPRVDVVLAPYRVGDHAVSRPLHAAVLAGRHLVVTPPCVPAELDASDLLTVVGVDDDEECASAIAAAVRTGEASPRASSAPDPAAS